MPMLLVSTRTAEETASRTEKALCPKCEKKFIEWMREKGHLATDCWCGHIEEFRVTRDA